MLVVITVVLYAPESPVNKRVTNLEVTLSERRSIPPPPLGNILDLDQVRINLALNLVAARTALDISQDTLATHASVSRATVIQIEGGEGDPRLSTLVSLADALGVSPMFLLLGREDLEALSDLRNAKGLHVVSDKLSEEDIETMLRLIRSGISRNRNKAIKMGTAAVGAVTAGATTSAIATAGIGSILLPGIGTVIGAILGGIWASKRGDQQP